MVAGLNSYVELPTTLYNVHYFSLFVYFLRYENTSFVTLPMITRYITATLTYRLLMKSWLMTDVRKIYCSGITGINHIQQIHCKIVQNRVIQTPCTLSNKKILKKRPSLGKDFIWFSILLCISNLKLYKKLYISNAEKSPKPRESFTSQMNPTKTCLILII